MQFELAEPCENLDILRYISTQGRWEIGLRKVMFGVRVSMTRIGDHWYTLDYCAGADMMFVLTLLDTVMTILRRYPEDVTLLQLEKDFPRWEVMPINRDPTCWVRLQEMAQEITADDAPTPSEETASARRE